MPKQKGFAHILLITIIILAGIGVGTYLVRNTTIFHPKAVESSLHPNLLVNSAEIQLIKEKINDQGWAKNSFARIQNSATNSLNISIPILEEGNGTIHNYLCPDGTPLDYSKSTPDSHYCPSDGKSYPGNTPAPGLPDATLRDVWWSMKHDELGNAAFNLALTYQLTTETGVEKTKYAQKAKEILLAYSKAYPNFKYHLQATPTCWEQIPNSSTGTRFKDSGEPCTIKPYSKGGKIYGQTLSDAVWLTQWAAPAYDLIWDSLTPTERLEIENFLRSAAGTVDRPTGANPTNHRAWINAALGSVGYLLNDQSLIDKALDYRKATVYGEANNEIWGFKMQICKNTDSDGFWNEGTGYHHYVMLGYSYLAEAAMHKGMDLYNLDTSSTCNSPSPKKFRNMFEVTKKIVLPNGRLPAVEDGSWILTGPPADLYDLAYSRFGNDDSFYPWLINNLDPSRTRLFSLLQGRITFPTAEFNPLSYVLGGVGYGVLQTASGDNTNYALLDFGPFGNHGHMDKLNIILYQNKHIIMPDLGNAVYGSPLSNSWYPQTLSHNTFIVDGKSQDTVKGELLKFDPTSNDFKVIKAKVDNAYPGVNAQRLLVLTKDYFIDSLEINSSESHVYDLPFHGYLHGEDIRSDFAKEMSITTSTTLQNGEIMCGTTKCNQNGYQYLEKTKTAPVSSPFWAEWTSNQSNLRIRVTGLNPSEDNLYSMVGPFPPIGNKQPFLIWRKKGNNAKFVSVIESYDKNRKIKDASMNGDVVTILFANGGIHTFNLITMIGTITSATTQTLSSNYQDAQQEQAFSEDGTSPSQTETDNSSQTFDQTENFSDVPQSTSSRNNSSYTTTSETPKIDFSYKEAETNASFLDTIIIKITGTITSLYDFIKNFFLRR